MEKKNNSPTVTLRSNASYPVEIMYNGEKTFIPPFGRIQNIKKDLLGPLPKCVRVVKQ